jgi:hypothetical protein
MVAYHWQLNNLTMSCTHEFIFAMADALTTFSFHQIIYSKKGCARANKWLESLHIYSYKEQRIKVECQKQMPLTTFHTHPLHALSHLLWRCDDAFVLSAGYVIQGALEVFSRVLETRCVLVGLEVGVNEFDEAVEVLGCDL